jgi:Arc/MetJ-type ribon-helix-helix transcriptional regulator
MIIHAGRCHRHFDRTETTGVKWRHLSLNRETNMATHLPVDVQQMVDHQLATGLYSSPEDVLREAMHLLVEHRETLEDLKVSAEDIEAGRLQTLNEAADAIRRRHGSQR